MARADITESGEISVLPDLPFAESASTVFLSRSNEKSAAETVNLLFASSASASPALTDAVRSLADLLRVTGFSVLMVQVSFFLPTFAVILQLPAFFALMTAVLPYFPFTDLTYAIFLFDDFHLTFLPGFFTVSFISLPTVMVALLSERTGFDAALTGT